ncbi:MAG: hypothetical protein ACLSGI_11475 [Butyricicoccaceae bacterium]
MKKAAIYCRLSEEDKNKLCATDDSGSIQNQKAMLVQYAEEQGGKFIRFTVMMIILVQTGGGRSLSGC